MRKGRCKRQLRQSALLSAGAHSSSVDPDMHARHHRRTPLPSNPSKVHPDRRGFFSAIHIGDNPFKGLTISLWVELT